MQRKTIGYTFIILMFGIFGLIIYGAYSPARKAQKQRIVCFKFKEGIKNEAVEKHMREFAMLKHEIPQIISYSAGTTLKSEEGKTATYDVMHYLTFQTEADIETYGRNEKYQEFVKRNQDNWEDVMVINSDIRQ
ncbi:Dabb family protein [Tellurirhabdus bombi]|uniref:Dabb family protein n=1 Tax=Tellurirhabdus bombi TaxID=2907205 RepID=UPI001F22392A|nr:Dabb family protein [Tellurirhabdus bombi]